jgi:hypothetical protein
MAFGIVQKVPNHGSGTSLSTAVAATQAGNSLFALIAWYDKAAIGVTSVTDGANNIWTKLAGPIQNSLGNLSLWWSPNAASATQIVVSFGSNSLLSIIVDLLEVSGLGASPSADVSKSGTGSGTALDTGDTASANAGDFALAVFEQYTGSGGAPTWSALGADTGSQPMTLRQLDAIFSVGSGILGVVLTGAWATAAAAGAYGARITSSSNGAWAALIVCIKPAAQPQSLTMRALDDESAGALTGSARASAAVAAILDESMGPAQADASASAAGAAILDELIGRVLLGGPVKTVILARFGGAVEPLRVGFQRAAAPLACEFTQALSPLNCEFTRAEE